MKEFNKITLNSKSNNQSSQSSPTIRNTISNSLQTNVTSMTALQSQAPSCPSSHLPIKTVRPFKFNSNPAQRILGERFHHEIIRTKCQTFSFSREIKIIINDHIRLIIYMLITLKQKWVKWEILRCKWVLKEKWMENSYNSMLRGLVNTRTRVRWLTTRITTTHKSWKI